MGIDLGLNYIFILGGFYKQGKTENIELDLNRFIIRLSTGYTYN